GGAAPGDADGAEAGEVDGQGARRRRVGDADHRAGAGGGARGGEKGGEVGGGGARGSGGLARRDRSPAGAASRQGRPAADAAGRGRADAHQGPRARGGGAAESDAAG